MPKKIPETRSDKESPKVVLKGKGLKEAEVNKPAVFQIDGRNAGPGKSFALLLSDYFNTGFAYLKQYK